MGSGVTTYTYTRDVSPILNSDCIACHNSRQHEAGYDFTTYAGLRRALTPGSAQSLLLREIQPGAEMYPNLTGDRTQKIQLIYDWIVSSNAAQ